MYRALALVVGVVVVLLIAVALWRTGVDIPDDAVLVLALQGELEEAPPLDPLDRFTASGPALPTLLLQLEKASFDERIQAVLVHIRPLQLSYARVQELRDALSRVRAAGKSVVALLDMASLNGTRELYLASSADRVFVVPGSIAPLAGIAGQYLHLGGMFNKVGIEIEYERVGRYKSAPESFSEREMSDSAREMMSELLDALYAQIVEGVSSGRELEPETVEALIDQAPSTADELVAAGLADGVGHRTQVLELAGLGELEEVKVSLYMNVDPRELGLRDGPAVALIFGTGMIVQGGRGRGLRSGVFAADRIQKAIEDAAEDEEIRAIVLRIDSGGGSSLASEQLWRAVRDARKRKPVVVSMAGAAASGGYYVASAADAIVAEPATLTGSIGIFMLRPVLEGLYEKLEVGTEVIERGHHAGILADSRAATSEQRERVHSYLLSLYTEFLARVSEGRNIPPDEINDLAEGRVWAGAAAHDLGLVDELGGLYATIARAKHEAGIDPQMDPRRVLFPGPRSLGEQLRDIFRGSLAGWLRDRIADDLLPVRLPPVVRAWLEHSDGGPAYLPTHWVVLH